MATRAREARSVPFDPVVDWWCERNAPHQRDDCVCIVGGWCASLESLARKVGISHSTIYRRRRRGYIDIFEADAWACRLGVHASAIWLTFDRVDTRDDSDEVLVCT